MADSKFPPETKPEEVPKKDDSGEVRILNASSNVQILLTPNVLAMGSPTIQFKNGGILIEMTIPKEDKDKDKNKKKKHFKDTRTPASSVPPAERVEIEIDLVDYEEKAPKPKG